MYNVIESENGVLIKDIDYFSLRFTLDCGQAFRWNRISDDSYRGIVFSKLLSVTREGRDVFLENVTLDDYNGLFVDYFDLNFDYKSVILDYKDDEYINSGFKLAYGTRLLKQPHFETIISFIVSANNNVKRIKGIIERLASNYGRKIADGAYSFPDRYELLKAGESDLEQLGLGYRASYVFETCRMIDEGFDIENISDMDYLSAKKHLQSLKGVGPKVADCILLYSYGFKRAFPIDVWIKRVLFNLYLKDKNISKKEICAFVNDYFGENAGILQLFLFNYARQFAAEGLTVK